MVRPDDISHLWWRPRYSRYIPQEGVYLERRPPKYPFIHLSLGSVSRLSQRPACWWWLIDPWLDLLRSTHCLPKTLTRRTYSARHKYYWGLVGGWTVSLPHHVEAKWDYQLLGGSDWGHRWNCFRIALCWKRIAHTNLAILLSCATGSNMVKIMTHGSN